MSGRLLVRRLLSLSGRLELRSMNGEPDLAVVAQLGQLSLSLLDLGSTLIRLEKFGSLLDSLHGLRRVVEGPDLQEVVQVITRAVRILLDALEHELDGWNRLVELPLVLDVDVAAVHLPIDLLHELRHEGLLREELLLGHLL